MRIAAPPDCMAQPALRTQHGRPRTREVLVTSTPEWSAATRVPDVGSFAFRVNGLPCTVTCRGDAPLLYVLRNDLGLLGSRFGCGLGQCGACMVLLDGRPTPSCDLPVRAAEGHEVVTIEGLSEDPVMRALQAAFIGRQAAQCGYCTSGILVSACALLRRDTEPDRAGVVGALDRNLCRCGSHGRVLRAVEDAARTVRAEVRGPAASAADRDHEPWAGAGPVRSTP
jgi:nicotinate dehydrogenase subunit A